MLTSALLSDPVADVSGLTSASRQPFNHLLREQAADLHRHVVHCRAGQGLGFAFARVSESLHAVIAPRFFSTVVVASLVLVLGLFWV
jgi:hypothetical protein